MIKPPLVNVGRWFCSGTKERSAFAEPAGLTDQAPKRHRRLYPLVSNSTAPNAMRYQANTLKLCPDT